MGCSATGLLITYSLIVTGTLVVVSVFYAHSETKTEATCNNISNGDQEVKTQKAELSHLDILSIDLSENNSDNDCTCEDDTKIWKWIGLGIFEFIVLGTIALGCLFAAGKVTMHVRKMYMKRKLAAEDVQDKKFEKLRARYEARKGKQTVSMISDAENCSKANPVSMEVKNENVPEAKPFTYP